MNHWSETGGYFTPSNYNTTCERLEAGCYHPIKTMEGWTLRKQELTTDRLLVLADSPMAGIVERIKRFWAKEAAYAKMGMTHKRGVFVWGAPGGGKTAMISLIVQDHIANDGVVFYINNPSLATQALNMLRQIEPTRRVLVIFEDLDMIVDNHGDEDLTYLLDGQNQISYVCYLATSNHPEKLPQRLINRPSRFDEVIELGMPSLVARKQYLLQLPCEFGAAEFERFALDSEGFSLAHLKEFVVAVKILEVPYDEALKRIRSLDDVPKLKKADGSRMVAQFVEGLVRAAGSYQSSEEDEPSIDAAIQEAASNG